MSLAVGLGKSCKISILHRNVEMEFHVIKFLLFICRFLNLFFDDVHLDLCGLLYGEV